MKNFNTLIFILIISISTNLDAQFNCGDDLIYSGKTYSTLQIGTQCWMGENIDAGNMITGSTNPSNDGVVQKYCYDNLPANCTNYGGLYKWDEAMQYITTEGAQGICPIGWHIPDDTEWYVLENYLDPAIDDPAAINWRGTTAGTILKPGGSSGFDVLMAGERMSNGQFFIINQYSYLWTSTQGSQFVAFYRSFSSTNSGVNRQSYLKEFGYSVRCIKNTTGPTEEPQSINMINVNISCYGDSNGSINLVVTGGTSPFTYLWSNGMTTEDIYNLPAGNYTVTISDVHEDLSTGSTSITQPGSELNSSITVNSVSCNGGSNGSIDLDVTGGVSPYLYTWSNGTSTQDLSELNVGFYSVTISDQYNCWDTLNINIAEPQYPLTIDGSVSDVNCHGNSTGSVNLSVSGGTEPYMFIWSNGLIMQDLLNVPAGSYTITVTDVNDCPAVQSYIIYQPVAVLSSEAESINASCIAFATGSAELTVNGGTIPYAFFWSNNSTTQDLNNIIAGTYYVTITDNNNCISVSSVTVHQTEITISLGSDIVSTIGLSVTLNPGVWDTYFWNTGETTQTITVSASSTYSVTVSEGVCLASDDIMVTFNPASSCGETLSYLGETYPTVSIGSQCWMKKNLNLGTMISGSSDQSNNNVIEKFCYNNNPTNCQNYGGMYQWNEMMQYSTVEGIRGICPVGWHIPSYTEWAILYSNYPSGTAAALLPGGSSGFNALFAGMRLTSGQFLLMNSYSYFWTSTYYSSSNAYSRSISSNAVYSTNGDKNQGFYLRCIKDTLFVVADTLDIDMTGNNVGCYGASTGSIDLTIEGGYSPFVIQWSNNATTEDVSGLGEGYYSVTVTDVTSTIVTGDLTIAQPSAQLTASATGTNVNCYGYSSGMVDMSVSGGTSPYTYQWSNSASTQDLNSIPAGTYTVTVTDINGCQTTGSKTVIQPATVLSALTTGVNINCYGNSTGSVDLTVSGGTAPYSYHWNNSATTQDLLNVIAGTYLVTVTDLNACLVTASKTLSQPLSALSRTILSLNVSCYGSSTGSIDLSVSGGIMPYSYYWSNAAVTQDLNNLPAGVYNVTITDYNGCTATASRTITQPAAPLSSSLSSVNVICYGNLSGSINLTVTGGSTPYTYMWSNTSTTQDLINVPADNYYVTITDNYFCTTTATRLVSQPSSPFALSFTTQNATIFSNGVVDLTVNGGLSPFFYLWSNGASTQDISGLSAGTYSVSVHDVNLCLATGSAVVQAIQTYIFPVPYIETFQGSPLDSGWTRQQSTGSYGWLTGSNLGSTGWTIPPHTKYAASNDKACNCLMNADKLISPYIDLSGFPGISLVFSSYFTGYGGSQGSVLVSTNGGQNWQTVYQMTPQTETTSWGTTLVNLSDYAGDTIKLAFLHNDNGGWASGFAVDDVHIYGFNTSDEDILSWVSPGNICVTGSMIPVTIQISNTTAIPVNEVFVSCSVDGGLTYIREISNDTISASDSINYTFVQNVTIPAGNVVSFIATASFISGTAFHTDSLLVDFNSELLDVVPTVINPVCHIGTGSVTLDVTGSQAPVSFNWSNGMTNSGILSVQPGLYQVTITDGRGCFKILSVVIEQPPDIVLDLSATNASCNGLSDGYIDLAVTGGFSPLLYSWYKGSELIGTTQNIADLSSGNYYVLVNDIYNCFTVGGIQVAEPPAILIDIVATEATQTTSGAASLIVTGGEPPYLFNWSNGSTTQNINNLSPGTYYVIVRDANDCVNTDNVIIIQTPVYEPLWTYQITNINHSILISESATITINNNPVQPGDFLGVFYDSLGTLVCGGYIQWTGSNTAITAWGAQSSNHHDGFQQGEAFKWKIFSSATGTEYYAAATYLTVSFPNTGYFATNGISAVSTLIVTTVDVQQINLSQGWNMISSFISPEPEDMPAVFSPVISSLNIVKNGLGNAYWPAFNVNLIGDWNVTEGYQVHMISQALLTIYGTLIFPESTPINLSAGWNMISYLRQTDAAIASMLNSIITNVVLVKDGLGNIYWPYFNVNLIGNMNTGKGYQLKISNPVIFTYPPNYENTLKAETNVLMNRHFITSVNTGNNMTLGIPVSAIDFTGKNTMGPGDEIGIFAGNGLLVGNAIFQSDNIAITIWGDDEMTAGIEGMFNNEPFSMMGWNPLTGKKYQIVVDSWIEGDEYYNADKISVAGKVIINKTENCEFYEITPNPCKNYAYINFDLSGNCHVDLSVFDLTGRKIETLINNDLEAGNINIKLNTEKYSSGTYYICINFDGTAKNRILSIVR